MPISKIKSSSITADAASTNLNIDANTLFLDATNNRVGVGTTSPLQRLDVVSSDTAVRTSIRSTSSGDTNVALVLQDGTTGTGADGIYLGRTGAVNYLWTYENEPWVFATNNTERMRIDSAGQVGIGTSSPSSYATDARNLVIASSGNTGMTIRSGTTSTGVISFANAENSTSNYGIVSFNHNDLSLNFNIYGTGRSYRFQSAGTEVLRITDAGKVGIGTASPAWPLTVKSSSSGTVATFLYDGEFAGTGEANIGLRFYNGGNANDVSQVLLRSYGTTNYTGNFAVNVLQGGTYPNTMVERFTIQGNTGNVGIGNTSPSYPLDVKNDSLQVRLRSSTNTNQGLTLGYTYSGGYGQINCDEAGVNQKDLWYTALTHKFGRSTSIQYMVLDVSGNLGIGTSAPVALLDVSSGTNTTLSVPAGVVGKFKGSITLNSLSTAGSGSIDSIYFQKSHGSGVNISNYDLGVITSYTDNGYAGGLDFYTGKNLGSGAYATTFAMRIDHNQNVGIGTTSPTTSSGYTSLSINNATNSGYVVLQNNGTNKSDWYISGGTVATLRGVSVPLSLESTGANHIKFETNATERMRIDPSGNVGIGTSSPNVKLEVAATTATGAEISAYTTNASGGDTSKFSFWRNYTAGSSAPFRAAYISNYNSDDSFNGNNKQGLGFYTKVGTAEPALGMFLDSSGRLNLNTLTDIADSYVQVLINSAIRGTAFVCKPTTDSTVNAMVFRNSSNGNAGYIQYNASTTTYVTSSDYRLKENILPMSGALERVLQLKPCTFKWKSDGSDGQGFIAHELAEICPQAVTGQKDAMREDGEMDTQGVDTSFLVATLTAAMQEQQTLITQLTNRITALEAK